MSSIRTRALDAAVALVGADGVRALTHGRVDAAAGLPPGSTSNHFRTRAALLAGVIAWIAEQERRDADAPAAIASEEQFATALTRMIEAQSGPHAVRTRARYALFLEAGDDESAAPLHVQREIFHTWVQEILRGIGGPEAAARTAFLMAACEGLLLHRITVDPAAPLAASVSVAVATALRGPA